MNRNQEIRDIINTFSVSQEHKDKIINKCITTYAIGKMISGDSKSEQELWDHFKKTVLDSFAANDKAGRAPEDSGPDAMVKLRERVLGLQDKKPQSENQVKFYKI